MDTEIYDYAAYQDITFLDYHTPVDDDENLEEQFANLSSWQWKHIENFTIQGQLCLLHKWKDPTPKGLFCNATWDGFSCWPATPANTTIEMACPYKSKEIPDVLLTASRICNETGKWHHGDWSNYTACFALALPRLWESMQKNEEVEEVLTQEASNFDEETAQWIARIVAHIYFYGGLFSSILLSVTFFIFSYFKTIQCNRISIHKHLVMSFIIRSILFVILFEPCIYDPIRNNSYVNVDWLCKALTALLQYATMANIFWMFVEGLFLHNRVAVSVFNREAPFRIFYCLGWGFPGLIVVSWVIVMRFYNHKPCWREYFSMPHMWIIVLPITIALSINTIFLINIIRILITKLRANKTMETEQVRKAVKATAVLCPLLGMTNVCFFIEPYNREPQIAYRVTNAALQSIQGIFVSVIYCFMNSEVRIAIMKKYRRYQAGRPDFLRERSRNSRSSSSEKGCSGTNVSKMRDSKDSASSKRGSQDSNMRRKDSQDASLIRKTCSQFTCQWGNKKRGSQESKRGSQSRSPIEESPEHEAGAANKIKGSTEAATSSSKRVRFFSISLRPSPDKNRTKMRDGTPPIKKKTVTLTLTIDVEPNHDPENSVEKTEVNRIEKQITTENTQGKDNSLPILFLPVTNV